MNVAKRTSRNSVEGGEHPFSSLQDVFRHARLGRRICWRESVDSTSTWLRKLACAREPEGTVVMAGHQTAGRGRFGRSWVSPAGSNLYMSVLIRPSKGHPGLGLLTLGAATAVAAAVETAMGVEGVGIKWPNDVLFSGRKVSGILAELAGLAENPAVLLGIGVNLNMEAKDFPAALRDSATSVRAETGREVDRTAFASNLFTGLNGMYEQWLSGDRVGILSNWKAKNVTLGNEILIEESGTTIRGRAVEIAGDGALLVEETSGGTRAIYTGDVTLR